MTSSFLTRALALLAIAPIAFASAASGQSSWRGGQAPDTPIRTTDLPPSGAAAASEIADRYLERVRTDRENADLWVYCAAAALKRGTADEAEAEAYARDIAATMRATLDRSATSPCEDAIPAAVWGGASPSTAARPAGGGVLVPPDDAVAVPDAGALTPAEEERLRRANAEADAQERARVAAQAAAQQRQSDAQARYDRERAQYEADRAAASAADAEYQRQLAERRRAIDSGQYREPQ